MHAKVHLSTANKVWRVAWQVGGGLDQSCEVLFCNNRSVLGCSQERVNFGEAVCVVHENKEIRKKDGARFHWCTAVIWENQPAESPPLLFLSSIRGVYKMEDGCCFLSYRNLTAWLRHKYSPIVSEGWLYVLVRISKTWKGAKLSLSVIKFD